MTENGSEDADANDGKGTQSEASDREGTSPEGNDSGEQAAPLADLLDEIDDRRGEQIDREPSDDLGEHVPEGALDGTEPTDEEEPGAVSEFDALTGGTDATEEDYGERRAGPLGAVADAVDERRSRGESIDEGLFAEEEMPEVDAEVVWTQLEEGGPVAPPSPDREEIRTVEKGTHCERCEYFSAPPEMHCTHDGTEIRELVDVDHVRVVNCPVVRENEELEKL